MAIKTNCFNSASALDSSTDSSNGTLDPPVSVAKEQPLQCILK